MKKYLLFLFLTIMLVGCTKEINVETEEDWEVTPTFTSEDSDFVGVEGKVGFLNTNFKAKEVQKVLWHFWGEEDKINGVVRVEGTHLETGEKSPILLTSYNYKATVWEYNNGFTHSNLGATKTMPSYVGFAEQGLWKISVYIEGTPFGEFILEVK
jgi:hypothetical protein